MSVVWRKTWRDIAHNKLRTLLAVLSTAVGIFALGLVFGLSGVTRARMTEVYRATVPAHINFWGGPFDQAAVDAVLQEPGVADAELEAYASLRWKLEGETEWRDVKLKARADYDGQRMYLIDLLDGHWPTGHALAVERQSSRYFGIPLNTTILVESEQGERRLPIEGIVRVHSIFVYPPPQFGGDATLYATPETIAWLTGYDGFDDLYIRLESFSKEGARKAAERIKDRLEQMGLSIGGPRITNPNVHFVQEQADTMFLILAVLGLLSLGLGAFLIINTINAIVAQQMWQIGVMKVIGATFGRIMRIYLLTALIYGAFASLIAVPLAAVGAHWMAGWMLDLLNIDAGAFQVAPVAVTIQIAVGLTAPVLAALAPVISGARISPHQAIRNYGLGAGFSRGRLDRLVGRIHFLPRPMALSLRNTFRRKARVALTLLTLTLGGLMFIVVMSVGASLNNTIELLDSADYDVQVGLDHLYPAERLVEVTESIPGVTRVEVWDGQWATLSLAGGEERTLFLKGVPPDSMMFNPRIASGHSLLPDDDHAILLNNKIAVDEGLQVGDEITLTIGGKKSAWTVRGLILSISNNQRECVIPLDTLAQETGNVNRGVVMVLSEQHDAESQQVLIGYLRDAYAAHHIEASWFSSSGQMREKNQAQFNILTYLMLSMAILAALVGSFGLMGTMAINVVERGREIGVMRAIGATSSAIAGIFVAEGVLLGALSWLLALPFSYFGARVFSNIVGDTLINLPLNFSYSITGVLLWLAIVVVLSALASLWPALRATKISVRKALTYE